MEKARTSDLDTFKLPIADGGVNLELLESRAQEWVDSRKKLYKGRGSVGEPNVEGQSARQVLVNASRVAFISGLSAIYKEGSTNLAFNAADANNHLIDDIHMETAEQLSRTGDPEGLARVYKSLLEDIYKNVESANARNDVYLVFCGLTT